MSGSKYLGEEGRATIQIVLVSSCCLSEGSQIAALLACSLKISCGCFLNLCRLGNDDAFINVFVSASTQLAYLPHLNCPVVHDSQAVSEGKFQHLWFLFTDNFQYSWAMWTFTPLLSPRYSYIYLVIDFLFDRLNITKVAGNRLPFRESWLHSHGLKKMTEL